LRVENLSAAYGAVVALHSATIEVLPGELVAVIGANGAGKSTMLRAICGILPAFGGRVTAGRILFRKDDITNLSSAKIVRRGIRLVPEGRRIFKTLTVRENLEMGAYSIAGGRSEIAAILDGVCGLFPILRDRRRQIAGTLSGGEQQMLAIARSLMSGPRLILADEPSLGLSPIMVEVLSQKLTTINKAGTAILLVEQNATIALSIAHRAYVYSLGTIVKSGSPTELAQDDTIRRAFLGL